jgi:hypothetical protein
MPARQLCPKVNLEIRGVDFVANLIVLESKSNDVILGMDWLSKYKVLIDCAKKFVKMTTTEGKEMEFIAEPVVTAKGVANCVKVNQMDASVIPRSEKEGTKPLYVCPGCSNHTYSNNMITRIHVQ